MFESEVYPGFEKVSDHLPAPIAEQFAETARTIEYLSSLHWSEHCTECAIPECYQTCDLYSPRVDGKCQRFVHGIQRIADGPYDPDYILRIQFKRWGLLQTQGSTTLYPTDQAKAKESRDLKLNALIPYVKPALVKKYLVKGVYRSKKLRRIKDQNKGTIPPDAFLMEIYNPNEREIHIHLTVRSQDAKYQMIPFQHKVEVTPGYQKYTIPYDEIVKRLPLHLPFRIDLMPLNIDPSEPLYFGRLDFVKFSPAYQQAHRKPKPDKIKCIVWDLDKTLWDGVLMEDGPDHIQLKEGIKDIIIALDEKGILHSVASKNDHDNALKAIRRFGLEEYFLYPEISWGPKSHGLKRIAQNLNINLNTFLFIDDNPFEREEVKAALPEVRVMDALEYPTLPAMQAFQKEATPESRARRSFYLTEQDRKKIAASFDDDYFTFLRSCDLSIELLPLQSDYHKRVYELAQRTNQMNFSGRKYSMEEVVALEKEDQLDKYVIKSHDKFGEYGIVGFGIVDKTANRLLDLMFSCRIQSKRVEHAFFTFLLRKYLPAGDFLVQYRKTERNKFTGQVFDDFGFEVADRDAQGIYTMKFAQGKEIPDDQIVNVIAPL